MIWEWIVEADDWILEVMLDVLSSLLMAVIVMECARLVCIP